MATCPKCSEEIDGFVPRSEIATQVKAKVQEAKDAAKLQLEAKDKERTRLEARVTELEGEITGFGAGAEELKTLRAKVERSDRQEILRSHGIDAASLDEITELYEARMAGKADEERQDFAAFMGPEGQARSMVLLKGLFTGDGAGDGAGAGAGDGSNGAGSAGAAGADQAAAAAAAAKKAAPNGNAGAADPGKTGKMTPQQLMEYFSSAEFTSMKREDQRTKRDELRAQHMPPAS